MMREGLLAAKLELGRRVPSMLGAVLEWIERYDGQLTRR